MVREIMKDTAFLSQKADLAAPEDLSTAADLLETLEAHKDGCVGMAANMIGVSKRIIAFDNEGKYMVMFNPEIIKRSEPYTVREGCLSLSGVRETKRWKSIKAQYQNEKFQVRYKTFTGWTAQIIQHEIDHCKGIVIRYVAYVGSVGIGMYSLTNPFDLACSAVKTRICALFVFSNLRKAMLNASCTCRAQSFLLQVMTKIKIGVIAGL